MSSFYKCVPQWIIRIIETRKCSHCQSKAKKEDIEAFGIRRVVNTSTYYVEHKCHSCEKRTITSFGKEKRATPIDLAYEIIEHEQRNRRAKRAKSLEAHSAKGEIGEEEVEELRKFMGETDAHEDFMKFIGAHEIERMTDEEQDEG
jgi:hypothetical protein